MRSRRIPCSGIRRATMCSSKTGMRVPHSCLAAGRTEAQSLRYRSFVRHAEKPRCGTSPGSSVSTAAKRVLGAISLRLSAIPRSNATCLRCPRSPPGAAMPYAWATHLIGHPARVANAISVADGPLAARDRFVPKLFEREGKFCPFPRPSTRNCANCERLRNTLAPD